ncbi:EVE domain-containing protein [Coleofasciculus sp. FACHB-SPT36]|uniref:EVE domain-containing protein n=1 Tax=Coleofasciculus sp. FACHB-SPT36 TaxID=2692790 RepID=UPI00321FDB20
MTYWLFQGNPKYYRLQEAIQNFEQMSWLMTGYGQEMEVGDGVLILKAGDKAGIYAIAEIFELSKFLERQPDLSYWNDKRRLGSKPKL